MKMYVANCSQQVLSFYYRLPGTTGVRNQQIDIGTQVRISGELSTPDIDSIAKQNAKYGLVREDEIDRTKAFVGMCFQVDRPVSLPKIRMALGHNADVLTERGVEQRKQAAVVINQEIEKATGPQGGLKATEVSAVEEDRPGHEPEFAEGFRVANEPKPGAETPSPRRKRGRRS